MRRPDKRWRYSRVGVASMGLLLASAAGPMATPSSAANSGTPVIGEGGSFLQPVLIKLLRDDTAAAPLDLAYTNVQLDTGIKDFVGSARDTFGADFAVSERQLTAAEAATAKANGRSFAYVPFAATPVAVATLAPTGSFVGTLPISSSTFCPHIPLSTTLLGDIFGFNAPQPLLNWGDSRLQCTIAGTSPAAIAVTRWANLDPTMENEALMTLLDSDPTSKALFKAGLQNAVTLKQGTTLDTTPSETWPYSQNTLIGGDQTFLNKLISINPKSNTPSPQPSAWQLGATFPISSVWTGAPMGVPLNVPTAAIQNAQGSYVFPSTAASVAAENSSTLAASADPTANNLVTFNASTTDAIAYNNWLMEESYLVVPTNGLSADVATTLAQFVRFALGPIGQADISGLGAAPASPAMVTAGLKVAAALNAEAATATTTSSSTTTTTPAPGGGSPSSGSALTSADGSGTGTGANGSSGLAVTGLANPVPLLGTGLGLVAVGEFARRKISRRATRR
jgi:ABC-type phosphate transport system substrate-binding protein